MPAEAGSPVQRLAPPGDIGLRVVVVVVVVLVGVPLLTPSPSACLACLALSVRLRAKRTRLLHGCVDMGRAGKSQTQPGHACAALYGLRGAWRADTEAGILEALRNALDARWESAGELWQRPTARFPAAAAAALPQHAIAHSSSRSTPILPSSVVLSPSSLAPPRPPRQHIFLFEALHRPRPLLGPSASSLPPPPCPSLRP